MDFYSIRKLSRERCLFRNSIYSIFVKKIYFSQNEKGLWTKKVIHILFSIDAPSKEIISYISCIQTNVLLHLFCIFTCSFLELKIHMDVSIFISLYFPNFIGFLYYRKITPMLGWWVVLKERAFKRAGCL